METNPDDMSIDELMEVNIYDYIGHLSKAQLEASSIDRLLEHLSQAQQPYEISMTKVEIMKASKNAH